MPKIDAFDGHTVNLYLDEDGDWLAHFVELPNASAFADSPEQAKAVSIHHPHHPRRPFLSAKSPRSLVIGNCELRLSTIASASVNCSLHGACLKKQSLCNPKCS